MNYRWGVVAFDPYDWAVQEDPYPVYRALREQAPCYHNAERGFWALSRHTDVLAAFRDTERFSSAEGVALEREQLLDPASVMSFLAMDPPRHDHLRALVSRGFTPRRVNGLEPHIRALASRYLDAFAEKGACDFIAEFAGKLPMDVISEMIGVPGEDRDRLRGLADTVVHREEGRPEVPAAGMQAAAELLRYFASLVDARRARPRAQDDLTDALIVAEIDGARLDDKEIVAFLFLMVIAGNETTTKLLGNALFHLARHGEQRRRVREDPRRIPGWVEETLRYDPSTQLLARTLRDAVELHGERMPAGARVALLVGAANRDPSVFDDPDAYHVERDTRHSLAFGQGTHFCLGAALARLEARVSLEEITRRMPDYAVREDGLVRVHSSNVRGFAALPIEFEPARRSA